MSKESDLVALAATVRDFVDQEVPTVGQWNVDPGILRAALTLLGADFTNTDNAHAALLALFNADHNPSTGAHYTPNEWVAEASPPTFLSSSQFQLTGDRRPDYAVGHRVLATMGGSTPIVAILASSFSAGVTTFTVEPAVLTSQLTAISRGLVRVSAPRVTSADILTGAVIAAHILDGALPGLKVAVAPNGIPTDRLNAKIVTAAKVADYTLTPLQMAPGAWANQLFEPAETGTVSLTSAGATLVAQALTPQQGSRRILCVVSGTLRVKTGIAATVSLTRERASVEVTLTSRTVDGLQVASGDTYAQLPVHVWFLDSVANNLVAHTFRLKASTTSLIADDAQIANAKLTIMELP